MAFFNLKLLIANCQLQIPEQADAIQFRKIKETRRSGGMENMPET
jgi:hypothetical protein